MDVLLPTDALEKTLRAEAGTSAARIRETAELEAREFVQAFDQETEALVTALRDRAAARVDRKGADLGKALPLGRRRLDAAFFDQSVRQALDDLADEVDEETWRAVFGVRLAAALPTLGAGVELTVSGWTEAGTEVWLGSLVPGAPVSVTPGNPGDRTLTAVGARGRAVYRLSVRLLWEELLETHREELVQALFPGRNTDAGTR
jgi:hypothetical protein